MKKYTNNNIDSFTQEVLNAYYGAYPFMKKEQPKCNEDINFNDLVSFFSKKEERKPKVKQWSTTPALKQWSTPQVKQQTISLESYIALILKYDYTPDYDFKDIFGTPVKFYKDYVQYGYDLISKEDACFLILTESKKKNLNINIKINLNY